MTQKPGPVGIGVCVWLAAAAFASIYPNGVRAAARQSIEARPAPGREVFLKLCSDCHGIEDVIASRRSRDQWREVIDRMVDKGAAGTEDELAATLRYLLAAYGRANLNKATAADIALVLGIPTEQAEAIVKYRTVNGPFEDFDALSKVPDLDVPKLSKIRDAIAF